MTPVTNTATRAYTGADCEPIETTSVVDWLREGQRGNLLSVRRVPLHQLGGWMFEPGTRNLRHQTGRFFSIHGIRIETGGSGEAGWSQPIIAQPEIGILGFLATRRGGEMSFLVQRKIEPGNVNIAQASPTVQATRSNYTRVHGGGTPPYLEFFLSPPAGAVIVDQLQQEQASRYRGKRNRNMVVEVDASRIPVLPGYRWTTWRELASLMHVPNALNLDTRSVLSCLPFQAAVETAPSGSFTARVHASFATRSDRVLFEARSWLAQLAREHRMQVDDLPLGDVEGWQYDGDVIAHRSGRYFEVIGVSVDAPTREVPRWDQPLVRSVARGVVGMLCQQQEGVLRVLVRAVLEAGEPQVRIGPTVQCVPSNHDAPPPFLATFLQAPPPAIRFRSLQSEEGGRFFHDERLLMVVEAGPGEPIEAPAGFRWLTLGELAHLSAAGAHVNIEARSLLACLALQS